MEIMDESVFDYYFFRCSSQWPSTFFKGSRGLRQEDQFSPLLFIVVMETLNGLMERAKELQLVGGV